MYAYGIICYYVYELLQLSIYKLQIWCNQHGETKLRGQFRHSLIIFLNFVADGKMLSSKLPNAILFDYTKFMDGICRASAEWHVVGTWKSFCVILLFKTNLCISI